jgi:signal peptidase II
VKQRIFAFTLAIGIIIIDQLAKLWVSQAKPFIKIIPDFFTIHYVENTGAAFGILQNKLPFLILVSIIASGILIFLIVHEKSSRWTMFAALGCILGGATGNLIDRIRLRYVVDFLQFYVRLGEKYYYWPSFNVADTAISVGVGLLILTMILQEYQAKQAAQTQKISEE